MVSVSSPACELSGFGGVTRALLLEPCYIDPSIGFVAAMAEVIASDVSSETLGFPPDDYSTYPVQLVPVLAMLLTLFIFVEANDRIGLTPFVIEAVTPFMTAQLLPVVVFVTVSLLSFTTGSNWGVIAISMPIAFPLAQNFGVSIPLVMGALFSASGFGSHACFYSDSTVLSAQGAGCKTHEHATTQLPYALLGAAVAVILFVAVA